jgi:PAS domain S-box-containing protein
MGLLEMVWNSLTALCDEFLALSNHYVMKFSQRWKWGIQPLLRGILRREGGESVRGKVGEEKGARRVGVGRMAFGTLCCTRAVAGGDPVANVPNTSSICVPSVEVLARSPPAASPESSTMSTPGAETAKPRPTLRGAIKRLRLAWKVNGLFLLILAAALGLSQLFTNLDLERAEVSSAREMSITTSERILASLRGIMMSHEANQLASVVNRMGSENPAFRDIRLIAHEGRIVASQMDSGPRSLESESWPCTICHTLPTVEPEITTDACCEILNFEDGERALSVVTPIFSEEGCSNATCHTDMPANPVLGILQADFSLAHVDALIDRQTRNTLWAILVCMLLGTVAAWWMTERLVGRRIKALKAGAQRLAQQDFSFRFSDSTGDGLSEVVAVFDSMTSELSEARSELLSTKEYLQAIVDNSADMIITVGPAGNIRTFNPGAEKILGYTKEEIIGQRIELLFAEPQDREAAIEQLENGDHVVNYMTNFVTKDGDLRNVMITLSKLLAPDGTPLGTLGISKDLTEELRLQVQLLRSKRLAALGQALTGIQHSIKNMLNVMKGGSYMVKLGLAKEDSAMLMEGWVMVREGIDDMTQMSMSMLDFARTKKLKPQPTDLGDLARKIHGISHARFKDSGVELSLDIAPDLPRVVCDEEGIRSVVMDLISNALDACSWKVYEPEEAPEVVLRIAPAAREGHIEIQVEDNAEGMTEEIRKRIFTPFFSTKEKKGTGVGLAVVSRIVESHEGDTYVESEPGEGATFRVLLPIHGPSLREE